MINLLNVTYFITVAEARSFSVAAKRLYVSQQTLSSHIAQMETSFGTPFFERTRPLTLTPAGERFLHRAREILFINDQLTREIQDMVNPANNPLRIGITHAYARALLPTLLDLYENVCPSVNLQIYEFGYDQMQSALSNGTVDILITRSLRSVMDAEVEIIPLWENDDVYLYAPYATLKRVYGEKAGRVLAELKKSPRLSLVEKCPFILPRFGNLRGNVNQMFLDARVSPSIQMETDTLETAIFLCRHGLGVTISPRILLNTYGENTESTFSESAYLISDHRPEYNLAVCYLKRAYATRAIQAFIDLAKEYHDVIQQLS